MEVIEEKQLVDQFLKLKSERLFGQLYKLYSKDLYTLALKLNNGDKMLTDDVLQETWMRAIKKLDEFRWDSRLKTWLCAIAINCCREMRRKTVSQEIAGAHADLYHHASYFTESVMDVKKALGQLPEGYREVIVLHDFEGYKHREIGEMLGISPGQVKASCPTQEKQLKN